MFSKLLHSLAVFLFSYNLPSDSESSLQVDQQLHTELEQAAAQGMVSTRSQDNTPAGGASQDVVLKKKRKTGNDGEESPAQPVMKRRRRSAKLNGDATPLSSASKPGKPRRRGAAKTLTGDAAHRIDHNESDQDPSSHSRPGNSPPHPGVTTDLISEDEKDEALRMAMNKPNHIPNIGREALDVDDELMQGAKGATRSRKSRIREEGRKDSEENATVGKNSTGNSVIREAPGTSFATAVKVTHKRFGSEDIDLPKTVSTVGINEQEGSREIVSEGEGESESGDDAPELVTASAGFDKARTSVLEAAKISARYVFQD